MCSVLKRQGYGEGKLNLAFGSGEGRGGDRLISRSVIHLWGLGWKLGVASTYQLAM